MGLRYDEIAAGPIVATELIAPDHYQLVKIIDGAAGSVTPIGTTANPFVTQAAALRTLLDYDTRLDGNPVYMGQALQTILTTAATWTIKKLFYDALNRLVDTQILIGSWAGRAALAWKPAGGD
ncbi:MAG: hypothetical protein ACRDIC_20945 [bacterium]